MEKVNGRSITLLICLWIIGSTILGRSFTALDPGGYDAQLYAYIGNEWLHGNIPYSAVWENKPPGIFAVSALVFAVFPKSFVALAFVEGIFILGGISCVCLLCRQWQAPWLSTSVATLTAAIATNLLYYNERGNLTEIYLLWPSALSMYFFSRAAPTFVGRWVVMAGFFSGIASLFKPPGLSPLLAQVSFVLLSWAVTRDISLRNIVASVSMNGLGVVLAWLPVSLYFLSNNSLLELMNASFLYNIRYAKASHSALPLLDLPLMSLTRLAEVSSLIACMIVGLFLFLHGWWASRHQQQAEEKHDSVLSFFSLALLWVFFDFLGALAGGRYYPHYFLPMTLSLSVVAGATFWLMFNTKGGTRSVKAAFVLMLIVLGPLLFFQASDLREMANLLRHGPSETSWLDLANHLNTIRSRGDTIFTWGYLPGINLATGMKSPIRLMDSLRLRDSPEAYSKFGKEIFEGLKRAPPTFFVETPGALPNDKSPDYREFGQWLRYHYTLVYMTGQLKLYKLNPL